MFPWRSYAKLIRQTNWLLTAAVAALMAIGVVFVYSAGHGRGESAMLYMKQLRWGVAGWACYFAAAVWDYRGLRGNAWMIYAAALVLLVVVLLWGQVIYGARRWLMLFGMGLQPSELAKLGFIGVTAWYLGQPRVALDRWRTVAAVLVLVAVPAALVLKEPDLGTALVLMAVALCLMFAGGVSGKRLAALALIGLLGASFVVAALLLPEKLGWSERAQERAWKLTHLSEYQRNRLLVFFHPERDPTGAGWNRLQSEIAVGAGGVRGKGLLHGTQNLLGFLPKTVAPTDFIFSVIAEETGFVGSATILGLFAVVFACGMWAAEGTMDKGGRLLCVGIVATLFTHVFINISMTVGLMPVTGLPLPLISYGGSFMISTMTGLGVVQSVYVRRRLR